MEEDIFEKIYYRYSPMLYKLSFLYVKNEADVLDIIQNTFIKFLKHESFNDQEHMKRWLIRTCINLSKNNLKSYWKKNICTLEQNEQLSQPNVDTQLQVMIFNLPPKYKGVIHLYYYEGYHVKEIANILNIKESAVKQRLKRGREKLKMEWENENEE